MVGEVIFLLTSYSSLFGVNFQNETPLEDKVKVISGFNITIQRQRALSIKVGVFVLKLAAWPVSILRAGSGTCTCVISIPVTPRRVLPLCRPAPCHQRGCQWPVLTEHLCSVY